MKAHVLPNTLVFDGILDEETSMDELIGAFEKLKKAGITPPVSLDFSKVTYANSAGIVVWLKFSRHAATAFKYVNAPVWLVNQFNMINNYFEGGSFVQSLQVPYYAPKTQDSRVFTLELGKDIPLKENYTGLALPNRQFDGKLYEIDISPERYFHFISENFPKFKEMLK
ncbi:MAG: hypothetical protein ACXVA9_03655 [Bdellovibrionales bacterium]